MPLITEVYNANIKKWVELPAMAPGDPPASMSNNRADGVREIYLIECVRDDSHSTIYRSGIVIDIETPGNAVRELFVDKRALEVVKTLRRGDEPYTMLLRTDISNELREVRFRHVAK